MKNILQKCFLSVCVLAVLTTAAQAQHNKRGWQVELKRAALDLSSTSVKHADDYQGFPNAKLTADSQNVIKGHLNLKGDYFAEHFVWGNELLMNYGKTTLKPENGEKVTSENADQILFTSSYTQRLWKAEDFLGGFEAGPYGALSYETEFNSQPGARLKKVLRAEAGLKVFEGKYIKNLFVSGFAEDDFTYNPSSEKYGWQAGFEINQPIREGVKAVYQGLFRDYLHITEKRPIDLDYELTLEARLDVAVFKELAIAPFIQYYTAQGRTVANRGQNLFVGVTFSFSHTFIKAKEL
ncbi:MAG: hypothetical protein J6U96_01645 [Elusimicrobiaceae bacterium]|nr:hypothetical protein [Elusimicrobiaceae bacterium]